MGSSYANKDRTYLYSSFESLVNFRYVPVNSCHVQQLGSSHVIIVSSYAIVHLSIPWPVGAYLISKLHNVSDFFKVRSTFNSVVMCFLYIILSAKCLTIAMDRVIIVISADTLTLGAV